MRQLAYVLFKKEIWNLKIYIYSNGILTMFYCLLKREFNQKMRMMSLFNQHVLNMYDLSCMVNTEWRFLFCIVSRLS